MITCAGTLVALGFRQASHMPLSCAKEVAGGTTLVETRLPMPGVRPMRKLRAQRLLVAAEAKAGVATVVTTQCSGQESVLRRSIRAWWLCARLSILLGRWSRLMKLCERWNISPWALTILLNMRVLIH